MNYVVVKGDTLGSIAAKFLGSSTKWRDLWAANAQISNPDILSIGQIIRIPNQSSAQATLVTAQKPVTPVLAPIQNQGLMNNKNTLMLLGAGVIGLLALTTLKND